MSAAAGCPDIRDVARAVLDFVEATQAVEDHLAEIKGGGLVAYLNDVEARRHRRLIRRRLSAEKTLVRIGRRTEDILRSLAPDEKE